MCSYSQHYRDGTPVCPTCKANHSAYTKEWKRNGPKERDGLPEMVADYVSTNQPVSIMELQHLIGFDKPDVKAESVRRVVYRLLDRGVIVRDGDVLSCNGYGVIDCHVCGRPVSHHAIGHCPELGGEPVLMDPPNPRTIQRRKIRNQP